jgi:hypothetical protein
MELDNRLQKAAADMVKQQEETRKAIAAAAATAAAVAPQGAPVTPIAASAAAAAGMSADAALANGDGTVLNQMRKQASTLISNAPGYARMLQESLMGAGPAVGSPGAAAAAAMGGPEHVPGQHDARLPGSGGGAQETELERRTRELQVGGQLWRAIHLPCLACSC